MIHAFSNTMTRVLSSCISKEQEHQKANHVQAQPLQKEIALNYF